VKQNFRHALTQVLKHEGGFVNDPRDRGGATNLGVTIGTLSGWLGRPATVAEVRALTARTVEPIYRKNYWDALEGDSLPTGLDLHVFDFGVNAGVSRAAKMLQRLVGVAQDGDIGPQTLAAIEAFSKGKGTPSVIIQLFGAEREAYYRSRKQYPIFGRGWVRRTKEVTAEALSMLQSERLRNG